MQVSHAWIEWTAYALEFAGIGAITLGAVTAFARFAFDALRGVASRAQNYEMLRANLGRGILLGLELLVGADIIATITAPLTLESVGLLAAIVAIRTFLSFSLSTEIERRFPWQKSMG